MHFYILHFFSSFFLQFFMVYRVRVGVNIVAKPLLVQLVGLGLGLETAQLVVVTRLLPFYFIIADNKIWNKLNVS